MTKSNTFQACVPITFLWMISIFNMTHAADTKTGTMNITRSDFGATAKGEQVSLYTLTNSSGANVQMTNYGAIIVAINVPDAEGKIANVNAGFDSLNPYLKGHPFFGATVGRFANRIAKGKFTIADQEYTLVTNNSVNHLHGGTVGFDKKVWQVEELTESGNVGLRFSLFSPDGDEGYPGNLHVHATYTWDEQSCLTIAFEATTDEATVINLTNHAYLNLCGVGAGSILEHQLKLFCKGVLDVDSTLIPTGKVLPVAGTVMDFLEPHAIGERIKQLTATKGYDHCFVVDGTQGQLRMCAIVVDPKSRRALEVQTTQPGVQLYTANHLPGNEGSANLTQHDAFCLETQHFPDSPNRPEFPTTLLQAGETFRETSTYRFYVSND